MLMLSLTIVKIHVPTKSLPKHIMQKLVWMFYKWAHCKSSYFVIIHTKSKADGFFHQIWKSTWFHVYTIFSGNQATALLCCPKIQLLDSFM